VLPVDGGFLFKDCQAEKIIDPLEPKP